MGENRAAQHAARKHDRQIVQHHVAVRCRRCVPNTHKNRPLMSWLNSTHCDTKIFIPLSGDAAGKKKTWCVFVCVRCFAAAGHLRTRMCSCLIYFSLPYGRHTNTNTHERIHTPSSMMMSSIPQATHMRRTCTYIFSALNVFGTKERLEWERKKPLRRRQKNTTRIRHPSWSRISAYARSYKCGFGCVSMSVMPASAE